MPFADREDAGRRLAAAVASLELDAPVVVALPRGGVPVAARVAATLHAPLDVLVVRKVGCPWQPELGVGAVAEEGVTLLNHPLVARLHLRPEELQPIVAEQRREVADRVRRYRGGRAPVPLDGRVVVLVDDGLATGFTARAAVAALRLRGAARVVLAVPVGSAETVEELRAIVDEVVCLEAPVAFGSIGEWYADFRQTGDEEVVAALSATS